MKSGGDLKKEKTRGFIITGNKQRKESKKMEAWQERVCKEKAELDEKIIKLERFISSDRFNAFDAWTRDRITRQYRTMINYSNILNERIINF
jgi:hypothetical protein